ncbi:hypothetical protein LTR28_013464, partial [Elasticomyces elasticus]
MPVLRGFDCLSASPHTEDIQEPGSDPAGLGGEGAIAVEDLLEECADLGHVLVRTVDGEIAGLDARP